MLWSTLVELPVSALSSWYTIHFLALNIYIALITPFKHNITFTLLYIYCFFFFFSVPSRRSATSVEVEVVLTCFDPPNLKQFPRRRRYSINICGMEKEEKKWWQKRRKGREREEGRKIMRIISPYSSVPTDMSSNFIKIMKNNSTFRYAQR